MRWASAVSEQFSIKAAVAEAAAKVKGELGGPPDLAICFVSPHHSPDYDEIPALIQHALGPKVLIGCSGGGVIGAGHEVEDHAGFSLTGALLPGVELAPFHVKADNLPTLDATPESWETLMGVKAAATPHFIILPDPFTLPAEQLLSGLDYAFPVGVKIGGLASGAGEPGGNALFLNARVECEGAVGLALSGNLLIETIVAQGCRPIGKTAVVTKCAQNVLFELDNRHPGELLRETYEAANSRDQRLIAGALHLGIVMDPLKVDVKPGDFLIRNVLGMDRASGGLVVGELLREGQLVQFHVRDANTATDDLHRMLQRYKTEHPGETGQGALLFSCLGRGHHLFGEVDHDTGLFAQAVGTLPLGGFFCNGEIGQVGPSTFLHGFTSSFGIFRPKVAG